MAIRGERIYDDLGSILEQARRELDRAGREVRAKSAQLEQLRAEEARQLARLAAVRLGELEGRRVAEGLDRADRRALVLLEQRREAEESVNHRIAASDERQRSLADRRIEAKRARDAAFAAHEAAAEATLKRLAETEAYEFQQSRVEVATGQAARAEEKARQAEADRQEKGRPYEEDKLFSYLWKRRYRYPEYRAFKLTKALDDWVAGLCRYDKFHRDYAMLLEIPVRLRAHADRLTASATSETEALAAMEQEALAADGVLELAETLAETERSLAETEQRIDNEEAAYTRLLDERAELASGGDAHTTEALQTLEDQINSEPVHTLRADAARTGSPEDDALVEEITELRTRRRSVESELEPLRARQREAKASLANVEELRRRFRQYGYDADDSFFDGSFDVGSLLGGLLRGALVAGDAWSRMGRHQRFRRRGRSSGASIAMNVLGSVLSAASRGGSIGGGFGGGGGFRTGGGFGGGGGGGFSTGGGF